MQRSSNISTNGVVSKLKVSLSPQSVGDYQCVAWLGTIALASKTAKMALAEISLKSAHDEGRRSPPPQVFQWTVAPGNTVLIHCGEVLSKPMPTWRFFK